MNILSYNTTGLDSVKINFINDLLQTLNITCCQVQEHFKATKTVSQFFKSNFKKYDCYVTPAVRDNSNHAGRPKGGLTQLTLKDRKIKKESIQSLNWRVQAQILHINDYKLLWLNAYFPTDPQTQNFDESEILATLATIEKIISDTQFNDILLGGDMNYDEGRNTGFCRVINEFLSKNDLVSIWSKFPCDFTYQHLNLTSFSTIDHFFVTESFLENCVDAAPMHFAENRSNHSPIMLKIKLPEDIIKDQTRPIVKTVPSWRKATDGDKDDYTYYVHEKLSNLPIPESLYCQDVLCKDPHHSHDRDKHIIEVMENVIEATYECLPKSKKIIHGRDKVKFKLLPGWNEFVAPVKDDYKFWFSVWQSSGKPNTGVLFNLMKWTRNKFHYAVRKIKRLANKKNADALVDAAAEGNIALFEEMKKYLYRKTDEQNVPNTLEGKVTHRDILDKFKECYETL